MVVRWMFTGSNQKQHFKMEQSRGCVSKLIFSLVKMLEIALQYDQYE